MGFSLRLNFFHSCEMKTLGPRVSLFASNGREKSWPAVNFSWVRKHKSEQLPANLSFHFIRQNWVTHNRSLSREWNHIYTNLLPGEKVSFPNAFEYNGYGWISRCLLPWPHLPRMPFHRGKHYRQFPVHPSKYILYMFIFLSSLSFSF